VVSTDARSSLDRPGFLAHRRGVDRKASCRCGSGRQYRNCCYSQDRAGEEARRAARSGLEQIESVVRVLLPLVESRGEHKVACKAGCNACCAQFVRASLPEALLIADWLRLPENAAVRARFEEKLPAWREAAQPETGELTQLMADRRRVQPGSASANSRRAMSASATSAPSTTRAIARSTRSAPASAARTT